jgi:hypothetical protein
MPADREAPHVCEKGLRYLARVMFDMRPITVVGLAPFDCIRDFMATAPAVSPSTALS